MRSGLQRAILAAAALAAASSCLDPWRSVTFVEQLRVLAVRAEPPDVAPGKSTQLDALVVDPSDPRRANTLFWFACDPDPTNLDQAACAQYATLEQANSGEFAQDALPEGVRALGMSAPAGTIATPVSYLAPADTFAALAPGDPKRTRGAIAIVLMMAVATPPPPTWPPTQEEITALLDKVKRKEVASVLTIKRLRVTEDPVANQNPKLKGVKVEGEFWAPGLRPAKVLPGTSYPLVAVSEPGSKQAYVASDADGNPVDKKENLLVSWFSDCGSFREARVPADDEKLQGFAVPFLFEKLPADRRPSMWVILRDGRGGVDFITRGLYVCEPSHATPAIVSIYPVSGPPGTLVKLTGTRLDELLDVRAGEGFLANGHWDAEEKVYVGAIPSDTPVGEVKLLARGRGCEPDPWSTFAVTP